MKTLKPTDEIKGFALTQLRADIERKGKLALITDKLSDERGSEWFSIVFKHLANINDSVTSRLTSLVEERGGDLQAKLTVQELKDMANSAANNYLDSGKVASKDIQEAVDEMLPLYGQELAGIFLAAKASAEGERGRRELIDDMKTELTRSVKDIAGEDLSETATQYAKGYFQYSYRAAPQEKAQSGMPTFYTEANKIMRDVCFDSMVKLLNRGSLKGQRHKAREVAVNLLQKFAEASGYDPALLTHEASPGVGMN